MTESQSSFTAENPLRTWAERLASFKPAENALLNIVQALDELDLYGSQHGKARDPHSGLPDLSEAELERLVGTLDDKSVLKQLWNEHEEAIHCYRDRIYNTHYNGARAFKNKAPYAPISLLVCPTRPSYTFEQYVEEASPQEIGEFFKSVLNVARQATDEHDAAVAADPARKARRDFYEQAFDEIRMGKKTVTSDELRQLSQDYMRESQQLQFAVRDPRTGRSGFRVAINTGSGVAGMSQPHFHVQITGGRYLGPMVQRDPAQYETAASKLKVGQNLSR